MNEGIFKSILIVGGSGYLGRKLASYLVKNNYKVTILSRSKIDLPKVTSCIWDPGSGLIDTYCLKGIDVVVNFAGTGIADRLWTKKRKIAIINSRVDPLNFLCKKYLEIENKPQKIISASAVGYYGHRPGEKLLEKSGPGEGFLPQVCVAWESEVDNFMKLGINVLKARLGVVIATDSGFVTNIRRSQKIGANILFGKGDQNIPWISLKDFLRSFKFLIENDKSSGAYNLCSPNYYSISNLQQAIAKKHLSNFHVPAKLFKLIMQDFSEIFLNDMKVLPEKLLSEGFKFNTSRVEDSL